jgi:hypothetical protein
MFGLNVPGAFAGSKKLVWILQGTRTQRWAATTWRIRGKNWV